MDPLGILRYQKFSTPFNNNTGITAIDGIEATEKTMGTINNQNVSDSSLSDNSSAPMLPPPHVSMTNSSPIAIHLYSTSEQTDRQSYSALEQTARQSYCTPEQTDHQSSSASEQIDNQTYSASEHIDDQSYSVSEQIDKQSYSCPEQTDQYHGSCFGDQPISKDNMSTDTTVQEDTTKSPGATTPAYPATPIASQVSLSPDIPSSGSSTTQIPDMPGTSNQITQLPLSISKAASGQVFAKRSQPIPEPLQNVKKFVCQSCGASFQKVNKLKEHQLSHEGITCKYCGKLYHAYSSLRDHMESKHSGKLFKCDACGGDFGGPLSLKQHKMGTTCAKQMARQKNFFCDSCGKGYKSKKGLKFHMKKHPAVASDSE